MTYKPTFTQETVRVLYSLLLLVLLPLIVFLLRKKTQPVDGSYQGKWYERFGFVPRAVSQDGVLFHCVSVGEVVAASAVIKQLRSENPEGAITITTTTPTGSARVKALFGDTVSHFYLPFDLPFAMNQMLRCVKPRLVVITEVELWPNMIHSCWKSGISTVVLNARMTERSAKRYQKFSALFSPMLAKLSHVCAQGQRDYDNYAWLGLDENKLTLTNNLKFDQAGLTQTPTDNPFLHFNKPNVLTLVGGSTHEGEESALIAVYRSLEQKGLPIQLVIVPRHPQRFDDVARQLEQDNVAFVKTSGLDNFDTPHSVMLVDEMGKLGMAYHAADIAFVGGSLTDKGGHNALEAAGAALPVIMGPSIYNNPAICEVLIEAGALTIVQDQTQLISAVEALVNDEQQRKNQGSAGLDVLKANQGALQLSFAVLGRFLQ